MSRAKVAFWSVVLAPIWPLLLALALKSGAIPASGFGAFGQWYVHTSPVTFTWIVTLAYAAALYVLSLATGNASIFDVHWSVLPASFYVVLYALHPGSQPRFVRAALVFGAVWFWAMRLTGNWLAKGGLGFEDFRYEGYRKTMSPVVFKLFAFVALFEVQAAMTITMTLPCWYALRAPGRPVGALDALAFVIVVAAVLFEWTADLQGMSFRKRREEHRKLYPQDLEGTPPKFPRFPTEGLWKWSRHPNYFGEICVWWGVYLFSVAQSGEWLNWTIVGPVTIHALFLGGSIGITEKHELGRKPEYAEYQLRTSRLVPLPPRR
ncbi:MAG: DUF1295 domain-containing protein [Polyangia bacterium]